MYYLVLGIRIYEQRIYRYECLETNYTVIGAILSSTIISAVISAEEFYAIRSKIITRKTVFGTPNSNTSLINATIPTRYKFPICTF